MQEQSTPDTTGQPTEPAAPMRPAAPTRPAAPYPPRPRRRGGCLRRAAGIGLTFLIAIALVIGGGYYLLMRQPERLLGWLQGVMPRYYPIAIAAPDGENVHVLYRTGSLVPDLVRTGNRPDLKWDIESVHGITTEGVWTHTATVGPFTSAVWFQDALWLLDTGGYRTWSDGAWSETVLRKEWNNPRGCVAGGKLWVFYEDINRVLRVITTTDGATWEPGDLRQQLPSPDEDDEADQFLGKLYARFRVAALGETPYVFWFDPARKKVRFRFYDQAWSQPHSVTGSLLFTVAATPDLLYFFDVPVWRANEEYGYDEATVTMRTFDGRHWSTADELDLETTLCLDASAVGHDIWLFTSSYRSLFYTAFTDGDWGQTIKVPKPKAAERTPAEAEDEPENTE